MNLYGFHDMSRNLLSSFDECQSNMPLFHYFFIKKNIIIILIY
jgi:hypothetical protein